MTLTSKAAFKVQFMPQYLLALHTHTQSFTSQRLGVSPLFWTKTTVVRDPKALAYLHFIQWSNPSYYLDVKSKWAGEEGMGLILFIIVFAHLELSVWTAQSSSQKLAVGGTVSQVTSSILNPNPLFLSPYHTVSVALHFVLTMIRSKPFALLHILMLGEIQTSV